MTSENHDDQTKELKVKAGMKARTINVDYLARVEGEGALLIKTNGNCVEDVKLKIFEPPRFFEAMLRGREIWEAPDITARICGICPIAYQMSAVHAIENALGVIVTDEIYNLRRLLYCGEWIESHTLHVYMLHAPDFLGYLDAIQMSKDHKEILKRGLRLKKAGNEIIRLVGGREIHPINVKVGGFYRLPDRTQLLNLENLLKQALQDAQETVYWVSQFHFPTLNRDYEFVSLTNQEEYPMTVGRISSSKGLDIAINDYEQYFCELQVPHSTALQSIIKSRGSYLTGPMARYNLNKGKLSSIVKQSVKSIGFEETCTNPFRSIIIRSLEILYACDEALRIIAGYQGKGQAAIEIPLKTAIGYGATEAPRGLLYHRFSLNEKGLIEDAKIVPPTSQNQKTIEEDLFDFVNAHMTMNDEELTWKCEQAIRNYDPCISCSAHFLKLERTHA